MFKIKLPRILLVSGYTTGDSQNWTYEYTLEDFKAAITMNPTAIMGSTESKLKYNIIQYFKQKPEIAKKNGITTDQLNTLIFGIY